MNQQEGCRNINRDDELYLSLPKMAVDIWKICCFKPANSTVTGLSSASASFALFSSAPCWFPRWFFQHWNLPWSFQFVPMKFSALTRPWKFHLVEALCSSLNRQAATLLLSNPREISDGNNGYRRMNSFAIIQLFKVPSTLQAIYLALGG